MIDQKKYSATFKVALVGARYIYQENGKGHAVGDSHKSTGGHMWYNLADGVSTPLSFGFSSRDEEMHGPGRLTPFDDRAYQQTAYEVTVNLTEDQYLKLFDFSEYPENYGFDRNNYKLLTNSCVDFAYAALQAIGYNKDKFQGDLFPGNNTDNLKTLLMTHGPEVIFGRLKFTNCFQSRTT